MKWWGWLVIAIGGSIMWSGVAFVLVAFGSDFEADNEVIFLVMMGGVILICSGCVVIPLVQKAIRAAKEDE